MVPLEIGAKREPGGTPGLCPQLSAGGQRQNATDPHRIGKAAKARTGEPGNLPFVVVRHLAGTSRGDGKGVFPL